MKASTEPHVLIEFALPPFGYVLTLSGQPLDGRPVSIAWFAQCDYDEKRVIAIPQIPILPTHEALPGDYRTKDEIRRDVIINILLEGGQDLHGAEAEADRIMASGGAPEFFATHGADWSLDFNRGLVAD